MKSGDMTMTREEVFFLGVLADFLRGRRTREQKNLNWQVLTDLMEKHQVGGILYVQCGEYMPEEARRLAEKDYSASVYYSVNRQSDLRNLDNVLRKEGIPYFIVKGLAVSSYYPVPELRTMGDTDLVVHPEDRSRVEKLLLQQGFLPEGVSRKNEWHFRHHGMDYELHDHLLYDETVNEGKFRNFMNDCWTCVQDDRLMPDFHFLFLLIHLRKHLMNTGVGFRQFMDLAVMGEKELSLDWHWIQEKLETLDLMPFASVCFGLIARWFDIRIPIPGDDLEDSFYQEATEAVFSNGIFGFDNRENRINGAVNDTRKDQGSRRSILHHGFQRLFPTCQKMRDAGYYRYLEKAPFLLPVAYGHRFLRAMRNYSHRWQRLTDLFPSAKKVHQREEYLKKWGL